MVENVRKLENIFAQFRIEKQIDKMKNQHLEYDHFAKAEINYIYYKIIMNYTLFCCCIE